MRIVNRVAIIAYEYVHHVVVMNFAANIVVALRAIVEYFFGGELPAQVDYHFLTVTLYWNIVCFLDDDRVIADFILGKAFAAYDKWRFWVGEGQDILALFAIFGLIVAHI